MDLNLERLLEGKHIKEKDIYYRSRDELAKLFGAPTLLRHLSGFGPILGLPFYFFATPLAENSIRKISRPRPLSYYHDQLVSRGLVEPEDITSTQKFLNELCGDESGLSIDSSSGYRFKRHAPVGANQPFYSMRGYSETSSDIE